MTEEELGEEGVEGIIIFMNRNYYKTFFFLSSGNWMQWNARSPIPSGS